MKRTVRPICAAICTALAIVLPLTLHTIPNAGKIFLPMHIPVLLCGAICGPYYGLACGVLAPMLSYIVSGMPTAVILPGMMCELAAYGAVFGAMTSAMRRIPDPAGSYISLVTAMLCGRAASGITNALIFQRGTYTVKTWLTVSFATAIPGIVIQLVAIPAVLAILRNAGVIDPSPVSRKQD